MYGALHYTVTYHHGYREVSMVRGCCGNLVAIVPRLLS